MTTVPDVPLPAGALDPSHPALRNAAFPVDRLHLVVSGIAFFAILFTERCPRVLFDFVY
jgi:hypothetical protein